MAGPNLLSLQPPSFPPDNFQGVSQPRAAAGGHGRHQTGVENAPDSPDTRLPRTYPRTHLLNHPLAGSSRQIDGASAEGEQCESSPAGQEPPPNDSVSNLDRLIEP